MMDVINKIVSEEEREKIKKENLKLFSKCANELLEIEVNLENGKKEKAGITPIAYIAFTIVQIILMEDEVDFCNYINLYMKKFLAKAMEGDPIAIMATMKATPFSDHKDDDINKAMKNMLEIIKEQ